MLYFFVYSLSAIQFNTAQGAEIEDRFEERVIVYTFYIILYDIGYTAGIIVDKPMRVWCGKQAREELGLGFY